MLPIKSIPKKAIILLVIVACGLGIVGNLYPATNTPASTTQSAVEVKKEVKKEVKHDWRIKSHKQLKAYFEQLASKLKTGVPDIDDSVLYYEEYESKDKKLVITKNQFYLAGNKNIKHKYTMTWRKSTGDILTLIIDGNVAYNDEKGKLAAEKD